MKIKNSIVRQVAYMTRMDIQKVVVEPPKPQPLSSSRPIPPINAICGVGWRAYNPLPEGIKVNHVCAMPLIVGRQKRDHRIIEHVQAMNRPSAPARWKVSPDYNPSLRDYRS
jgi:hypothetical protein